MQLDISNNKNNLKCRKDNNQQSLYQESDAEKIQESIKVLNEHRQKFKRGGKNVEAEMATKRIAELKQ